MSQRPSRPRRRPPPCPRQQSIGSVAAVLAPPTAPWRTAPAVAVDNAIGADKPECGANGRPPCKTIRYGVSRALSNATVTVRGGGAPYLGECGGVEGDPLSSASGIQPTAGDSLAIVLAAGGGERAVIDCEGKGRAFRFSAPRTIHGNAKPGSGAAWQLVGLEVRNGDASAADDGTGGAVWAGGGGTLALEGCVFVDCLASQGGAVNTLDVQISVSGSSFVRCTSSQGGGMNVLFNADLVGLAAASIDGCHFTDTSCKSSVDICNGGGMVIHFNCSASNTAVVVHRTRFSNSTAISGHGIGYGGGLDIFYAGPADHATTAIVNSDFTDTHADNSGGGAYIDFHNSATSTAVVVRKSRFSNATALTGGGFGFGGGLKIYFGGPVDNATTTITDSNFTDTRVDNSGGGAYIHFEDGSVTSSAVDVRGSHFINTTAKTADGVGFGGGLDISYFSTTRATRTKVLNTTFIDCSAGAFGYGGGGGLYLLYEGRTNADTVLVNGSHFERNRADGGVGGGMLVQVTGVAQDFALDVWRSTFVRNTAGGVRGGAGLLVDLPQDLPQNLIFVGTNDTSVWRNQSSGQDQPGYDDDRANPFSPYPLPPDLSDPCSGCGTYPNGCGTCPEFEPYANANPVNPLQNHYRHWQGSNTFAVRDSVFVGNAAHYQGGAIAAPGGGSGTIENTMIEGNAATQLFGGGVFVGGTVSLTLANSTLRRNTCGQRGSQIFSSSGAGIDFDNTSRLELGCATQGDCRPGFSAAQAGNVTWGGDSGMVCDTGFLLLNSSALHYSVAINSWKLEPPSLFPPGCKLSSHDRQSGAHHHTPFHSNCSVVTNKTNCPCYFANNPYGGMTSFGFGTNPITPPVLVSTLSYACRACPRNTYNPMMPMLDAANATVVGVCETCPYGSSCADGKLVATHGFWGSSSGSLSAFRCPDGYCCDNRATPCDRIDVCAGNRSGTLCGGCALGFAQTIGSTACRATAECGSADAVWFVPLALALAGLFALYARKSQVGTASRFPFNAVSPMMYFYQMAQLLPVGATAAAGVALGGLFNMQLNGIARSGGFACPFSSLTTLQQIKMHYAVPTVVALLLALGYAFEARRHRGKREKAQQSTVQSLRLDYQLAGLKALSLAFSTVLNTTFQLLHCVDLRPTAGSSVVFRTATVACGAWQAPLYAFAFVLLICVAQPLAAAAGVGHHACAKVFTLPPAIAKKLRAPYRDGCEHWEAVLALHRLIVVILFSFVGSSNSIVGAVLQTVVCTIALAVHLGYRPFST
jgi:hypothetical protein